MRVRKPNLPSGVGYARLRDVLDAALVNRLPDVEILTAGGPGVPALAASYARSRGLPVAVVTPDYQKHRGDAVERQLGRLVEMADAAVVCDDATAGTAELVARLRARGVPVVVVGPRPSGTASPHPERGPTVRGLPD